MPPDAHLLCGAGSSLYLRANGEALLHSEGVRVNRWLSDPNLSGDGFFTHLLEDESGHSYSLLDGSVDNLNGRSFILQLRLKNRTLFHVVLCFKLICL